MGGRCGSIQAKLKPRWNLHFGAIGKWDSDIPEDASPAVTLYRSSEPLCPVGSPPVPGAVPTSTRVPSPSPAPAPMAAPIPNPSPSLSPPDATSSTDRGAPTPTTIEMSKASPVDPPTSAPRTTPQDAKAAQPVTGGEGEGVPWWPIVLIVVGVVLAVAGVSVYAYLRRR